MANFIPTIHPWNQQIWQNLTLEPERANHALLFSGNEGLGKQALAFALAHFVLIDTHSQSESLFNGGSHPDFHLIMPESAVVSLESEQTKEEASQNSLITAFAQRYLEHHNGKPKRTIGIEQIRKLTQVLTTHPHISEHRVVLIMCAEAMNRNAANALLKNLEEPPANTLFIIVSDEISKLAKTVRSRCSLINFRAPDQGVGHAWLEQQGELSTEDVSNYLAMANNNPLLAYRLFKNDYIGSLKSVFTDVNGLWNHRRQPIDVAKNWQTIGAIDCITILQKLTADLLKSSLSDAPKSVFFPVQEAWVRSSSSKISKTRLMDAMDALNSAKQMLSSTVDELLVLETVSIKIRQLPAP